MKVQIQSRKLVKPCKPTPSHLRSYKISMIDELNPPMHVIRILYYSPDSLNSKKINFEESVARVLPLFYPLAGRYIKDTHTVECNDEGAELSEARVDCELSRLILSPTVVSEQLNDLLPLDIGAADELTDPMLAIQVNWFQCGGLAIGVCASHRIFDACSLSVFLTAWASAVANDEQLVIQPDFSSPWYFPSEDVAPLDFGVSRARNRGIVGRRFVFNKDAIWRLRDRAGPAKTERPLSSRVVVVSAVLTQALLRADRARRSAPRASLIAYPINVRERTVPPVPKHACGTWVSISYLEYTADQSQMMEYDFRGLVSNMREAIMQGVKDCARILREKEFGRWVLVDSYAEIAKKGLRSDYKVIYITDWSKFGDYQLDFGFGKPVWVSLADVPLEDLFILMNTKENDGIEAWVYLNESDMRCFEQDEDIRTLCMS